MCWMVCHCTARIQHPTSKTLLVPMTMGLGSTSSLSGVIFSGYLQGGRFPCLRSQLTVFYVAAQLCDRLKPQIFHSIELDCQNFETA